MTPSNRSVRINRAFYSEQLCQEANKAVQVVRDNLAKLIVAGGTDHLSSDTLFKMAHETVLLISQLNISLLTLARLEPEALPEATRREMFIEPMRVAARISSRPHDDAVSLMGKMYSETAALARRLEQASSQIVSHASAELGDGSLMTDAAIQGLLADGAADQD